MKEENLIYRNEALGEIKYQMGEGYAIGQLLAL